MAYHSEGIGKNKKILRERKKPLPFTLMKIVKEVMTYEANRTWPNQRRDEPDINNC